MTEFSPIPDDGNDIVARILQDAANGRGRPDYELTGEEAKRLCEYSLDIVCISDFTGQILWANSADQRITGFSAEELCKMSWLEIIHPDDRALVISSLQNVANGVLSPGTEIRTRCKDGTYKWISWSGVPLLAENKIYAIGRDVTPQRIAQAEIRKLAAIVQSSTDAIFSISNDRLITSWNRGAEALYGYSRDESIGKPVSMLALDPPSSKLVGWLETAGADPRLDNIEDLHKSKIGLPLQVAISMFRVADESGGHAGSAAIVRDISRQKEAEKRIAEFYSVTSHELRTPLTSIRGVLGLLEGGIINPVSAEATEFIRLARASCDQLVRLVNDILDLRRIESGALSLSIKPVSIAEVISVSMDSVTGMAMNASVDIELQVKSTALVLGDRDRLAQVLTNLLSNAIKYSEPGQKVEVSVQENKTGRVRVAVKDRGPGIPAPAIPNLFRKFGQVDASDSRPKEGIGLGLVIAKSLVDAHDGTIGVLQRPGGGAIFWFELDVAGRD